MWFLPGYQPYKQPGVLSFHEHFPCENFENDAHFLFFVGQNHPQNRPQIIGESRPPGAPGAVAVSRGVFQDSSDLFCTLGVMGGFMQPQGHLQVGCGWMVWGMDGDLGREKGRMGQKRSPGNQGS